MSDAATTAPEDNDLLRDVAAACAAFAPEHPGPLPVGVAVSGGGDSLALLHLMHRVAPLSGLRLQAATVDHGLRPASATEAATVGRICAGLGISHDTLLWAGPAQTGNLMDQARRARLSLIADWARARGISHVVLGHTADDQAESFLMNLSRSAGLEGLSGMRLAWQEQGVHWARPLCGHGRQVLRDYLRRHNLRWIDDPTNDDPSYARVRARQALAALRPLGITVQAVTRSMANLAMADSALVQATAAAAAEAEERAGSLWLPGPSLWALPPELRRRLLNGALRWMNGASYPPRADQLARLETALAQGRAVTLAGVQFRHGPDQITLTREPRAVMGPVPVGALWDHRWRVTSAAAGQVCALGAQGLRQVPDWRATGVARAAALVSPAIWQEDRLVSAPILGFGAAACATITPSFQRFLLSH
ncbi:tRNA lysidine(34) synthetase TilS [Pseudotabrizicola sp. L79]|uniref:tRNA lysidine(34) synthetase TilS n=1 Tax=Pseudotabrizicola sp. L79 TaxID=3118402 RepID=UPI002F958EF9